MKRVHSSIFAAVLAATTNARADGGVYPADTGYVPELSKTRAQVIAETQEARRLGLMPTAEGGFPEIGAATGKTRAQVIAETQEAQRLGLLNSGDGDLPVASGKQRELITAAGRDAIQTAHRAALPVTR